MITAPVQRFEQINLFLHIMPKPKLPLKVAEGKVKDVRNRQRQCVSVNFTIRPRWVTMCREMEDMGRTKTKKQVDNEANLVDNTTKGQISQKSKIRLITAIDWVIYAAQN